MPEAPPVFGRRERKGAWDHGGQSRHARGYGSAWEKLRLIVLQRDCYLCQPCRRSSHLKPAREVDHIKPKAQGGTDALDNLEPSARLVTGTSRHGTEASNLAAGRRSARTGVTSPHRVVRVDC